MTGLLPRHVVFGAGAVARLGELARDGGIRHALVVSDRGIIGAGYTDRARRSLSAAGVASSIFHEFSENPDSDMVEAGRRLAAALRVDGLIGLGGGSSMDVAKAVNLVLTGGGSIGNYRGYGKAAGALLPMIGVPTTAGTGSEAQTYALISDARSHEKMACGDPGIAFRAVILDPELTVTQPARVTAASGYDAIAHAVETWVTTRRSEESEAHAREAWRLLGDSFERVLSAPYDIHARGAMLLGAYYAGAAIERSMLGATHACANPLTARYGTTHGVAVAMLLRHVVRWNSDSAHEAGQALAIRYAELASDLQDRLAHLALAGQFPPGLAAAGVSMDDVEGLSEAAAEQWTGTFNPRPFDARGAREIYELAW